MLSPTAGHPLDVLSEHHMVVQTLKAFVNAQLSQLQLEVSDMATGVSVSSRVKVLSLFVFLFLY